MLARFFFKDTIDEKDKLRRGFLRWMKFFFILNTDKLEQWVSNFILQISIKILKNLKVTE